MKKIIINIFASGVIFGGINAQEVSAESRDKGFAFYEETEENRGKEIKKDILSLLQAILEEEKKQTKLQEQILAKLDYLADEPKMVEVNGKKCLANSSPECFVMPITGDAKRIPVMRKWIENPTMENAINYYLWQTIYLNKAFNAGYAYHFSTMSVPNQFKGIPNYMERKGDSETTKQLKFITERTIKTKAKNMELLILLGENLAFDIENNQTIFNVYDKFTSLGIRVVYVFRTQENLKRFNETINAVPVKIYKERWSKIDQNNKIVSTNTYSGTKNIQVHITPMYVIKYDEKNKHFTQVLGAGRDSVNSLMETLPRSLIYWDVFKASDFSASRSDSGQAQSTLENLEKKFGKLEEGKAKTEEEKKAIKFKKILENEIKRGQK